MQVLVTRAAEDAARTASALSALGHRALMAPVIRIVRTADDRPPGRWDALIVTSLHGAEALADWPGKEVRSFAVGPRTAEALRRQGFAPIATAEGDAVSLSALILRELPGGASLLHVTGRHHKEEPARSLQAEGYAVVHWETYEAQATEALPATVADALRQGRIDAALQYSRRSAELFLKLAGEADLGPAVKRFPHLCLSADVAEPLRALNFEVRIAASPDEGALLRLLDS